jgi:hypothetical protein
MPFRSHFEHNSRYCGPILFQGACVKEELSITDMTREACTGLKSEHSQPAGAIPTETCLRCCHRASIGISFVFELLAAVEDTCAVGKAVTSPRRFRVWTNFST